MRQYGIVLILGLVLAFIAFQARTGIFRRANPGAPANKYTREMMEGQQMNDEDLVQIRRQYSDAAVASSGLRTLERTAGSGEPPAYGAEVTVSFEARLLANGQKVDSSRDRGEPCKIRVGTGAVVKGLDEALATMRPGEKRTLIVPWWLAYGTAGRGVIPPRATLVFEVERLD